MKKFLALILALVMVLSLSSVAFAGTITTKEGSEVNDVTVNVTDVTTNTYKVVINWTGYFNFTYETNKTWDPDTHTYRETKLWKYTKDGATESTDVAPQITIDIHNHSNQAVTATVVSSNTNVVEVTSGSTLEVSAATVNAEGTTVGDYDKDLTGWAQAVCTVGTTGGTATITVTINHAS